jgi:hypothetical protein
MDGMVSQHSCVEDTTRHQLLQQVCSTHKAGIMAGAGAIGSKVSGAGRLASTDGPSPTPCPLPPEP